MKYVLLTFCILLFFNDSSAADLSKLDIYQRIFEKYNETYQEVSKREIEKIKRDKESGVWGGLNTIGYKINNNFGEFSISIERYIEPALKSDMYISRSIFEINISASKLFQKLNDIGETSFSKKQLAAFASVKFKRRFSFSSLKKNYLDALSFDLDKLFFPFNYSNIENIQKMQNDEYFIMEDFLEIKAGAFATIPISGGVGAGAGILFTKISMGSVEVESRDSVINITSKKEKGVELKIDLRIVATFLKFLKTTLFQSDFSYSYSLKYTKAYSIDKNDILNSLIFSNLQKLLKQKPYDQYILEPFIVTSEISQQWTIERNFGFLFWGSSKLESTKRQKIIKDNVENIFFTHTFSDKKFKEKLKLDLQEENYDLQNRSPSSQNISDYLNQKEMSFTYKSSRNILTDNSSLSLDDFKDNFSIKFTKLIKLKVKSNKYDKKINNFLTKETNFNNVENMIKAGDIIKPFSSSTDTYIHSDGIFYLTSKNALNIYENINSMCKKSKCVEKVLNKYFKFYRNYMKMNNSYGYFKNCIKIVRSDKQKSSLYNYCKENLSISPNEKVTRSFKLKELSSFIQEFYFYSKDKNSIKDLFGEVNVFQTGSFKGKSRNNEDFITFFKDGNYRNLGIIDELFKQN